MKRILKAFCGVLFGLMAAALAPVILPVCIGIECWRYDQWPTEI